MCSKPYLISGTKLFTAPIQEAIMYNLLSPMTPVKEAKIVSLTLIEDGHPFLSHLTTTKGPSECSAEYTVSKTTKVTKQRATGSTSGSLFR